MATLKAAKKIKKLKSKKKKKTRPRPWDKPQPLPVRRATLFGSIRTANESRVLNMSYCTKARKYKFCQQHHFTIQELNKYNASRIISEDSKQGSQFEADNQSMSSSILSFPKLNADGGHREIGFPTNLRQKKVIICRLGCDDIHIKPKRDLYNVLRDRFDPDHSESPLDPLYCFKALCMREALLFHPEVRATLDEIWHITDVDNSNSISFNEYEQMHEAMSIAV